MRMTERLAQYLREEGVPFEVQRHPMAYTAQEVAASEHISGKLLAKVVMLMADDALTMLVLPASCKVNFAKAAEALGARSVRLAHEEEFGGKFPGCDVGAMPPFGNLFGLPTFVDLSLTAGDTIYFAAGTHQTTMSMKYRDFARLTDPTVVDIASVPVLVVA